MGQVLWDDLNFEREFYLLPRDTYGSIPAARSADTLAFDAWRELGADAVFFGTVEQKGDDVLVRVQLLNVRTRQSVFAKEYASAVRNARRIAHTIADEVHMQQANLTGIARTRFTFTSDRTRQPIFGTVEKRNVKEVYVSDYDGANQQQITSTAQLNNNPTWSADGNAIAYAAWRNNLAPEIFVSFIYQGVLRNVTGGRFPDGAYVPVYSPDGRQIAFAATPRGASSQDIYVMNADGTNARRLTTHPDIDTVPTWSPGGTQIAFTSRRTGRPRIYIMNVDGSDTRPLPVFEDAETSTWSPAPYNEIAYAAFNGTGFDIKVYDFTTNSTRQLTFGQGTNESPTYSPTGRHLAFTSTRRGNVQLFIMGRDGQGVRQVTTAGNNTMPDWSPVRPIENAR
jgi:TolB protein